LLERPLSAMRGVPVTVTVFDIVTVAWTMSPALYALSVPAFDEKLTELTVGAVLSIVTVRPDEVDVTVESGKTVLDSAVITFSPVVKTPVSHDHAPVVLFATQVFPDDAPSTKS
jgi:hypothetical protein